MTADPDLACAGFCFREDRPREDLTAGWFWYDYLIGISLGMLGFYDPGRTSRHNLPYSSRVGMPTVSGALRGDRVDGDVRPTRRREAALVPVAPTGAQM